MYDSNLNLINKFHSNKDCAKYLISNNYTSGKLSVVTSSISQSIRHNKKQVQLQGIHGTGSNEGTVRVYNGVRKDGAFRRQQATLEVPRNKRRSR